MGEPSATAAAGGQGGRGAGGAGAAGGSGPEQLLVEASCPENEFVTAIDSDGMLTCSPVGAIARSTINSECSVYLGASDGCTGCSAPPKKWGRDSESACANGSGADNTCAVANLGGNEVQMFGLNTDGDVNNDDSFYAGFHCEAQELEADAAPCDEGEFVTTISGGNVMCSGAASAVLDFVRSECSLYFGWRDVCDGCTSSPQSWGRVNSVECEDGAGTNNTCASHDLDGTMVQLYGLATFGDVNGDDKFYVGLHCEPPAEDSGTAIGGCPAGQFVTGTHADGTIECRALAPLVHETFRDDCAVYFGWLDGCGGCTTAPSKWGQVRDGLCVNDIGPDNTCATASLASETVELFGLNTDGDVGEDDKFFIAFECL